MQKLLTIVWVGVIGLVAVLLLSQDGRSLFENATRSAPYTLGFFKIGLLGTMGELLSVRIVTGRWQLTGIRLPQRFLVWGFLGWVFTAVFPLFSYGVDGLLAAGLLPGAESVVVVAFFKSTFTNLIFGFPMMVFHRFTDSLIERGMLFCRWPVVDVFANLHWPSLFRVVGFAVLWFWIPAHTITFLLPPEYRVMAAALLAIVLGFILGIAKRRSLSECR